MAELVRPFRVEIPQSQLDDLRRRLALTRYPEPEPVADWSQGVPLHYLKEVVEYWAGPYDWRRCETSLNAHPQFLIAIDEVDIHFLHVRSNEPGALALVLTHGWPGSVLEFLKVIPALVDPVAHGGRAEDAFHVVVPSLPGYGFSGKPAVTGWGVEHIADAWVELMARLGYESFGAQGGDWGSAVTSALGLRHPGSVVGIHVNMPIANPAKFDREDMTESEVGALNRLVEHERTGTGYSREQSTRPQTIGYSLVDSPVGLAAWIIEKFHAWSDCDGDPESVFTRDELLDEVMMYWLGAAGASAARLYWESYSRQSMDPITVPTGISIFPQEIIRLSQRWAATRYADIRYYHALDRGGHFAALEQPAAFVDEVRAFFRLVR